ncbi:MAG: DUF4838 domain-containing protein [Kiritimatiellae bacterium]|nr:DUF4838 domain-containing protein [Kiritimatiellia bacterium]
MFRPSKLIWLCLGAAATLCAPRAASAFDLARDGRSDLDIVIPAQPSPSVNWASRQLADYLHRITGATFAVVRGEDGAKKRRIRLGFPYDSQHPEEYSLRVADADTLEILGEGPRGPVYGVFALLEHLGCGFWCPGNETVPNAPTLTLPDTFRRVSHPAFEYRQPLTYNTYDRVWRTKLGINGDMWMTWREGLPEQGGAYHMNLGQWVYSIPRKSEDLAGHPDWMALRDGRRTAQGLCLTNEELLQTVAANIIRAETARKTTDIHYYSVNFADNDNYCRCAKCAKIVKREEAASGLVLHAANHIGRAIADQCPNARLMVLAYWVSRKPPKRMKPEPNVHVAVAHLRDFTKPPSKSGGNYVEDIRTWGRLTHGNVFIWDYNCNFRSMLTPAPIIDMMGPTFREYRKLGVRGVFSQMGMNSIADFHDLRSWLFGKLAWNPDQDEWKLIDQWCDGACGAGSPHIKEWLRFEKKCLRGKGFGPYLPDTRPFFDAGDILKGHGLFQKAIEATKDDPRANAQVRKCHVAIIATMLTRYNFDIARKAKALRVEIPSRDGLIAILEDDIREFKVSVGFHSWAEGVKMETFMEKIRKGEWLK